VFENLSFAENGSTGFLSCGFTGLDGPTYFGPGESVRGPCHVNGTGDTLSGGSWMKLSCCCLNLP
jgi:hypothetical protein